MITIKLKEKDITFAALKLIEQLYKDKKISEKVYRSIISENAAASEIWRFTGFTPETRKRTGKKK